MKILGTCDFIEINLPFPIRYIYFNNLYFCSFSVLVINQKWLQTNK